MGVDLRLAAAFQDAVASVLEGLQARTGLGLWMLLRQTNGDGPLVVLAARDRHYGIRPGHEFAAGELPVGAMVDGRGPRVAPAVAEVAVYAAAPASRSLPIGQELDRQALQGRFEQAELDALTDPLTGVGNRRAWDRLLDAEEARCARYGSQASLVAIDLDELKRVNDAGGHGAGDALLRRTAKVIESTKRAADVVARLGGDEFGVLAVECDAGAAAVLADRIGRALEQAGIRASVGHATRRPAGGLAEAWAEADAAMYARKRRT
jgi:diguanylate cyclase